MKPLVKKRDDILSMVKYPSYEETGKVTFAVGVLMALLFLIPFFLIEGASVVFFLPVIILIIGAAQWGREHRVQAKIELRESGGFFISGGKGQRIAALYVWPQVIVEKSYMTASPVAHSKMQYGIGAVVEDRKKSLRPLFEEMGRGRLERRPSARAKEVAEQISLIARSTKPLLFHKDLERIYQAATYIAEELDVPVVFAQEEIKIRNRGRLPEVRLPSELRLSLPQMLTHYSEEALSVDQTDYPPKKEVGNGILRYSWTKSGQLIGFIFGGGLGLVFVGIGIAFFFASDYRGASIVFVAVALWLSLYGVYLSRNHGLHLLEIGGERIRYTRGFLWKRVDSIEINAVKLIFYNDFPELLILGESRTIRCTLQRINPYILRQEIHRHIAGHGVEETLHGPEEMR